MCGDFKPRTPRYNWYNLYKHGHTPTCHLGGTASPNSASKGAFACWINMGIFLSLSACTQWNSTTNGSKPNIRAMVYQCLSKNPQWKLQYLIFAIATEILPTGQSSTDWLFSIEKGQITGPGPVFRHTLPESWSTQKTTARNLPTSYWVPRFSLEDFGYWREKRATSQASPGEMGWTWLEKSFK